MSALQGVLGELRRQRWDDHRYYHQSRINQSLHLVSAVSFLCAYALLLVDPLAAILVGWCVGMVTRQTAGVSFRRRCICQALADSHARKRRLSRKPATAS